MPHHSDYMLKASLRMDTNMPSEALFRPTFITSNFKKFSRWGVGRAECPFRDNWVLTDTDNQPNSVIGVNNLRKH